MHKRATSKKRAAEAEKEISMEDTEATPVEEVEAIIKEAQGDRPEPNRVTESVDMKSIMEYLKQSHEDSNKEMEENS